MAIFLILFLYWHQVYKFRIAAYHADQKAIAGGSIPSAQKKKHIPAQKLSAAPKTPEFDFYTVLPKMHAPSKLVRTNTVGTIEGPPNLSETAFFHTSSKPTVNDTHKVYTKKVPVSHSHTDGYPTLMQGGGYQGRVKAHVLRSKQQTLAPSTGHHTSSSTITKKQSEPANYVLQVGLMHHRADAKHLSAKLHLLGFNAHVHTHFIHGKRYYRVLVGSYAARENALTEQAMLTEKHIASVLIRVS